MSFTFTLNFLWFCQNFHNPCYPEHLEIDASVYAKKQNFGKYILGKLQICRLRRFLPHLSLTPETDPSVYVWKHLLKNVEKIKHLNTLNMLSSQRQDFADLDIFIFCFYFLAATNTDLLCFLLLPTDCSLNAIKKSFIIHPHSKTTSQLSKLKEPQFRVLELFCYLGTWSTQKASALSRQTSCFSSFCLST